MGLVLFESSYSASVAASPAHGCRRTHHIHSVLVLAIVVEELVVLGVELLEVFRSICCSGASVRPLLFSQLPEARSLFFLEPALLLDLC